MPSSTSYDRTVSAPMRTTQDTTTGAAPVGQVEAARARRLLIAGLLGAHAVGIPVALGFGIVAGRPELASAGLGFAMVVLFSTVGQLVMVRLSASRPHVVMLGALASYLIRCALLTVAVAWVWTRPDLLSTLDPLALVAATISTVVGWLTAEVICFSRMRIQAYDVELPEGAGA